MTRIYRNSSFLFDGGQNPCLNAVRSPLDKSLIALKRAAEQRQQSLDEERHGNKGERLHEEVEAVLKEMHRVHVQIQGWAKRLWPGLVNIPVEGHCRMTTKLGNKA